VVRKVIRSQATEFRYQRDVQPQPKIGPWRERLDSLLLENDGKPARERLTLIRVFEELRGLGHEGGYDAVRRYARAWSKERASETASAYVPLSFAPGEPYPFDWSHDIVVMDGVTTTVKAAHLRLCHSRMMFVRAYPRETQEMVFDAHDRAFAFFRGACSRGVYDNMKTAWKRSSSARIANTIADFCRCARIISSSRSPARRRRAGRRAKSSVRHQRL
jgi:transposase